MKAIYRSKLLWVVVALLVGVLIVRAMLPIWVRDYVNRRLSEMEDYRGHIDDVDIHLWRGAYSIHVLKIVKTSGNVPVPFFSAPVMDLSVEWRALFDGAFVGEVHFESPEMNLVNAASKAGRQAPLDEPWAQKVKELFPLRINRFTVSNGVVHYRDFSRKPNVDIVVDRVAMVATNLTKIKNRPRSLRAETDFQHQDRARRSPAREAERLRESLCRDHFRGRDVAFRY